MIPIPGRHRGPLPPQIDPGSFLDMVELVESQTFHESQIQAKIDQLSTAYFYVYCDIEAYNIRKVVLALEAEKYILHSETKKYLYGITSHHQRISHVVFEYPDARLEEESSLGSAVNRAIKKIIEVNEDKNQPTPTQKEQEKYGTYKHQPGQGNSTRDFPLRT